MKKQNNKPSQVPENWENSPEVIKQAWEDNSQQFDKFKEIFDKKFQNKQFSAA